MKVLNVKVSGLVRSSCCTAKRRLRGLSRESVSCRVAAPLCSSEGIAVTAGGGRTSLRETARRSVLVVTAALFEYSKLLLWADPHHSALAGKSDCLAVESFIFNSGIFFQEHFLLVGTSNSSLCSKKSL